MAKIVVIVPFRDWGALVDTCVAACVELDDEDFVVCLIADRADAVPERWAHHPRVEVIGLAAGISRKRNAAIAAHPAAAYYACIDSDAWPERDWLGQARAAFATEPELWLVGGPNLSPPSLPFARRIVAAALSSPLVGGPKVFVKSTGSDRDANDLPACNLILSRSAIDAIGGFDESMEVGEDSVLCEKVIAFGRRIGFRRAVRVWHLPRALGQPFLRQRIVSGYGSLPLIARCGRTMGMLAVATELLPTAALLFFTAGGLAALASPALGRLWLVIACVYLVLVGSETVRVSERRRDWPATALAIVIGNLAPGIGVLYRLTGRRLDLGNYYRNDAMPRP